MVKRKLVQFLAAFLTNGNLPGFLQGRIWQGASKAVCVPGLNCYSCPGALGACPLGSLQNTLAGTVLRFPAYALGLLVLFGAVLGRTVCGWLCPFGLVQELLYKIPVPKLGKNRITRRLTYLKYVVGLVFVLLLPVLFLTVNGTGAPAFCTYICPAGTLEAALPLLATHPELRAGLGGIFAVKVVILLVVVGSACFIYRPFCRFLCPLGAWYGLFNKFSCFGVKVDQQRCDHCGACARFCKLDVQVAGDRECICCGACRKVCPQKAISLGLVRSNPRVEEVKICK